MSRTITNQQNTPRGIKKTTRIRGNRAVQRVIVVVQAQAKGIGEAMRTGIRANHPGAGERRRSRTRAIEEEEEEEERTEEEEEEEDHRR